MAKVTTLEAGLKRILRICPDIVLNPESIQDIIDGKTNKVICEAKGGTYVDDVYTEREPEPERKPRQKATTQVVGRTPKVVVEDRTEDENITTSTTTSEDSTDQNSEFDEYFKT